ncbi:inorganic phosphate transporter [Pseudalkalibacillus salsuginis]|uniref:inorganic phosphate transporter n=1 Tax=Pseudalkalibacillus salsuginis TaxID=2910972 RepID=UPI001F22B33F|nr:inorganic phosphate transporter [Pseudalkalibacillus salsuginis]MCF6408153.1 inorganic phosphate transporter family protein [Pseudalkalibacillus salsuginis]
MILIAFSVAFFFAMNMGASGAAASMGVSYGSGAVNKKFIALVICGAGVFLGAVIGGGAVVETIGSRIVPADTITMHVAVIILASATISLGIANLIGIPLSTSEVTVGSVVGVGLAYQSLYVKSLMTVVLLWILIPIIAFLFTVIIGIMIRSIQNRYNAVLEGRWKKWLTVLLVLTGFFEAFSAGMNNVGNAIGPLVGAGMISSSFGTLIGGGFIALGAILFGGKVLETNGKRITKFSLLEGSAISGTGATLVTISSIFGIPVPLTQITTSAIIGIGTVKNGLSFLQKNIILQMVKVWVVSPVFSLVISYGMVKVLLDSDFYTLSVIGSVFIATAGSLSLIKTIRAEKRTIHEQGGI